METLRFGSGFAPAMAEALGGLRGGGGQCSPDLSHPRPIAPLPGGQTAPPVPPVWVTGTLPPRPGRGKGCSGAGLSIRPPHPPAAAPLRLCAQAAAIAPWQAAAPIPARSGPADSARRRREGRR